jgi:hypothetical protein
MGEEKLLPVTGTLYTVYDFIEHCSKGLYTDKDGKGYYSDGRVYWEDKPAIPSDIVNGKLNFSWKYRYVIWFEK